MKFFVTGGAGYIGSHFVKLACERGYEVLTYDNLSRGHRDAVHPKSEFIRGDVNDFEFLHEKIERFAPDFVVHFAALAIVPESVSDPLMYYRNNVLGVANVLRAIVAVNKEIGLIFSSTCAIFGYPKKLPISEDDPTKPESPYGQSKLMAEQLIKDCCAAHRVKAVALRYFNACGLANDGSLGECHEPETHLIPNLLLAVKQGRTFQLFGKDYPTKDGTCVRDYIHVMDLAEAHILAAQKLPALPEFSAFHLGTGVGLSNLEVLRAVEAVVGKKLDVKFEPRRQGDPAEAYANNARAQEELGFVPRHSSIDTIVQSAWNWFRLQD